jgi:hypothetical protein
MNSFWERLDLTPTDDLAAIKKAYAAKLKKIDIVADALRFQELREAYLAAQEYARIPNSNGLLELENEILFRNDVVDSAAPEILDKLVKTLAKDSQVNGFDATSWLNTQAQLEHIDTRNAFSEYLMHEFIYGDNEWSYEALSDISKALHWQELNLSIARYKSFLFQFENLLEHRYFQTKVLSPVSNFFAYPWQSKDEALKALNEIKKSVKQKYQESLSYTFYTSTCASSSAWIAVLSAHQFFRWRDLPLAQSRPLELAIAEAVFKEKISSTNASAAAPMTSEESAIWRLKQPFSYCSGIWYLLFNSIDSVILVIQKAEAYNIKSALNAEQVKFYYEHFRGDENHHSHRALRNAKVIRRIGIIITIIIFISLQRI